MATGWTSRPLRPSPPGRSDADIAAALLKAGADPDPVDENVETPLLFACATVNVALSRLLLEAGADVDAVRWSGDDTALLAAVHARHRRTPSS